MTRVVIGEMLRKKLGTVNSAVELCDGSGRTLGHFVPLQHSEDVRSALEQCPYGEEDLAGLELEDGGRTLPEIWKHLRRK